MTEIVPEEVVREGEYDVVRRRSDGARIVIATCLDGLAHAFEVVDEGEVPTVTTTALCGQEVLMRDPTAEDAEMCEACAGPVYSWARGGFVTGGTA